MRTKSATVAPAPSFAIPCKESKYVTVTAASTASISTVKATPVTEIISQTFSSLSAEASTSTSTVSTSAALHTDTDKDQQEQRPVSTVEIEVEAQPKSRGIKRVQAAKSEKQKSIFSSSSSFMDQKKHLISMSRKESKNMKQQTADARTPLSAATLSPLSAASLSLQRSTQISEKMKQQTAAARTSLSALTLSLQRSQENTISSQQTPLSPMLQTKYCDKTSNSRNSSNTRNTGNRYNGYALSRKSSISSTGSAASSRSNGKGSRRAIFSTLYESKRQDTSLFKNQDRQALLDMPHSFPVSSITAVIASSAGAGATPNYISKGLSGSDDPLTPTSTYSHEVRTELDLDDDHHEIDQLLDEDDKTVVPLTAIDVGKLVIPPFVSANEKEEDMTHMSDSSRKNRFAVQTKSISPTSIIMRSVVGHSVEPQPRTRLGSASISASGPPSILRNSSKNLLETLKNHDHQQPYKHQIKNNQQLLKTIPKPPDLSEIRHIASERSIMVSPRVQQDQLNKTIHCISGLDLSTPPKSLSNQSTITTNPQLDSKSADASKEYLDESSHHSITLRKSLSDSCLYSFQALSLLASNAARASSSENNPSKLSQSVTSHSRRSSTSASFSNSNSNSGSSSRTIDPRFSRQMTRHISHEEIGRNKIIRFDPRIWVHEIQCPPVDKIWYNETDMSRFKYEAILRIRKWSSRLIKHQNSTAMISTGTGRILSLDRSPTNNGINNRIIYTNPALSCDAEEDDEEDICMAHLISLRETALLTELKSVLIVDSHDIFLNLLGKGLKLMLPHVQIITACTVEQASMQIEKFKSKQRGVKVEPCSHGFDLIIIEERLKPHVQPTRQNIAGQPSWKGSSLIRKINDEIDGMSSFQKYRKRHPLIIGISAYLEKDKQQLQESGSDMVWGKPPPRMDDKLRMEILKKVMLKRNRPNIKAVFQTIDSQK
jgi:hypothetical protein